MGNSWGHTLVKLSEQKLAELEQVSARYPESHRGRAYKSCTFGRMDHLDQARYLLTYDYVTGRAGRVSFASKLVCEIHAQAAAKKYGIDLDVVPEGERPKHALERLADEGEPF